MSEQHTVLSSAIKQQLKESDRILLWVQSKLDGMKIPQLPDDKRSQLAAGCWHVAIEHSMAIVPRPTISLDSDLRNYNAGGSGYVQRNEGGIRNREGSP